MSINLNLNPVLEGCQMQTSGGGRLSYEAGIQQQQQQHRAAALKHVLICGWLMTQTASSASSSSTSSPGYQKCIQQCAAFQK